MNEDEIHVEVFWSELDRHTRVLEYGDVATSTELYGSKSSSSAICDLLIKLQDKFIVSCQMKVKFVEDIELSNIKIYLLSSDF